MKVQGVITGAQRLPEQLPALRCKLFIQTMDASIGELTVPVSEEIYRQFARNAVNGPFEVEIHLNFDKPISG